MFEKLKNKYFKSSPESIVIWQVSSMVCLVIGFLIQDPIWILVAIYCRVEYGIRRLEHRFESCIEDVPIEVAPVPIVLPSKVALTASQPIISKSSKLIIYLEEHILSGVLISQKLETLRPQYVLDLRVCPSFDFFKYSRKEAFNEFDKYETKYLCLPCDSKREDFIKHVTALISKINIEEKGLIGTLLVLISTEDLLVLRGVFEKLEVKCHVCGGQMERDVRPMTFEYKSWDCDINQAAWYCVCGESVMLGEDAAESDRAFALHKSKVDVLDKKVPNVQ